MTFNLPLKSRLFEKIATVALAQELQVPVMVDGQFAVLMGSSPHTGNGKGYEFNYAKAFIETSKEGNKLAYQEVLAAQLSVQTTCRPIQVGPQTPTGHPCVMLCPYPLAEGLGIDMNMWGHVCLLLRGYGLPLVLMAEPGQWLDSCGFAENEILTELPFEKKLRWMASAELIVGVPNVWMWMAAGMEKKLITLYPEWVPPRRWFPYASNRFGRILFEKGAVQMPALLAGLRTLIGRL
ncbi:MAG: hypothetical protein KGL39_22400 [Patescibacteria group bacterium]|nr:hypothetical protein [Patescibacteria group bacterium]